MEQKGAKEAPTPRPNKKRHLESEAGPSSDKDHKTRQSEVDDSKSSSKSSKNDEENGLKEFMQVMQPRTKDRTWNDSVLADEPSTFKDKVEEKSPRMKEDTIEETPPDATDDLDDLEWMKRRMTANVREEKVFEQDEDDGRVPVNGRRAVSNLSHTSKRSLLSSLLTSHSWILLSLKTRILRKKFLLQTVFFRLGGCSYEIYRIPASNWISNHFSLRMALFRK